MSVQADVGLQVNEVVVQDFCLQSVTFHQSGERIEVVADGVLHLVGQLTH